MDSAKELISVAIQLEKSARELVDLANGLYDRAVVIAIHDAECLSRHVEHRSPIRASEEERVE